MLQIQRASAGSGKTYTLARKYILLLISTKESGSRRRRLRNETEITEAVGKILAITFTNKATNEMRERIILRLADLASDKPAAKVEYLEYFMQELDATEGEVRSACRVALSALLTNYSDFQVSTIDSFFQSVLRTFAYESDLNGNYEVELDSDYLHQVGIDAVLSQVNTFRPDPEVRFWLEKLMHEWKSSSGWNVFQKQGGAGSQDTLYGVLLNIAKTLNSEAYKRIRRKMKAYFAEYPDFGATYRAWEEAMTKAPRDAFAAVKTATEKWESYVKSHPGLPFKKGVAVEKHIAYCKAATWKGWKDSKSKFSFDTEKKRQCVEGDPESEANRTGMAMYRAVTEWKNALDEPGYRLWKLYSAKMSLLGLLNAIERRVSDYLKTNNLVELGETNMMLRRVIGNDLAPFIYERLGNSLDHFLIDEFQDTSRLQWKNLRPLLYESEARGCDNLIIGDAKQSIYRFRNADINLITRDVPNEFDDREELGSEPQHNTNHRSSWKIVEFNNSIFKTLTEIIDEDQQLGSMLEDLYFNTVQPPGSSGKIDRGGYVEIRFVSDVDKQEEPLHFSKIPPLVASLIDRGYKQSDIALLVTSNDDGKQLIHEFMAYNAALPPGATPINFISEQSLLISESEAVKSVIGTLEMIRAGMKPLPEETETETDRPRRSAIETGAAYRHYCTLHPNEAPEERLHTFLRKGAEGSSLAEMLSQMQSVTLPAIIDSILATNVNPSLLASDVPFISAFMDLVLDYCERYPADVASFLDWWEKRGQKQSISSPDGTEAVQVMTIHKSKGLEFKCVILPYVSSSLRVTKITGKNEVLWVAPALDGFDELPPLPPRVPVTVADAAGVGAHMEKAVEAQCSKLIDNLNTLYVGFTRAIHELYVFAAGNTAQRILTAVPLINSGLKADFTLPPRAIETHEENDEVWFSVGTPSLPHPPERKEADKENGEGKQAEILPLEVYSVNSGSPSLACREADLPDPDEEDPDPRSIGNLKHLVLESIRTAGDLDRSVKRLVIAGRLSEPQALEILTDLREALARSESSEWFAPGLRVITERPIIRKGEKLQRPDRVVVDAANNAIVIDYKFGSEVRPRYKSQVKRYVDLLRQSGLYHTVTGKIWYVNLHHIESID